jgi:regulator of protease activity HflC (stomatin/prohibitin superfamily)
MELLIRFIVNFPVLFIVLAAVFYVFSAIRILNEYERGVIFRLGRVLGDAKGPGIILVLWPIDTIRKVSLQTHTLDVPPQDVITRDNVSVHVNAVLFFQVMDPVKAVIAVEDYLYATSQMAQTTLRSVLGQQELDDLLSEREKLNLQLQKLIDHATEPWGVKVSAVEIKKVDLPQEMQRAMAKQAEAERERRAKVIAAEGEYQAAEKLVMAADKMSTNPVTIQMRYLQSLTELGGQANNTVVFPFPLEFVSSFINGFKPPVPPATSANLPATDTPAGDQTQPPTQA